MAGDLSNSITKLFAGITDPNKLQFEETFQATDPLAYYRSLAPYQAPRFSGNALFNEKQTDLLNMKTPEIVAALKGMVTPSPMPQLLQSARLTPRPGSPIPNTADPQLQALLKRLMQR